MTEQNGRIVAGWREWVSLPDCDVPWIKAKLDTGARSSALHAYDLRVIERDGVRVAEFDVHPWQRSAADSARASLPVIDERTVRSSTGHEDRRVVVRMTVVLAGVTLRPEVTLSRRDEMGFRMLIGRQALRPQFLVDSGRSYLGGKPPTEIRRRNRRQEPT